MRSHALNRDDATSWLGVGPRWARAGQVAAGPGRLVARTLAGGIGLVWRQRAAVSPVPPSGSVPYVLPATPTRPKMPFMNRGGDLLRAPPSASAPGTASDEGNPRPPRDSAPTERSSTRVTTDFRARWLPRLLGCGLYLVVGAFVFGSPARILSNSHMVGGAVGDPVQLTWFLTAPIDAIVHGHHGLLSFFYTPLLNYPAGANLATNTSAPLLSILVAPITLTVGPFAAFNVLCTLSLVLSACSMFLVLHRWVRSWLAAFAGGLLFGFSPFMITQAGVHPFLTFLCLVPIFLLVLDEILIRQEKRTRRWGIGLGVLCGAQYLISPEVLMIVVVTATAGVVILATSSPRLAKAKAPHALRSLGWALPVFVAIVAYPVWFTVAGPGHIVGPPHSITNLETIAGDLLGGIFPKFLTIRYAPMSWFVVGGHFTQASPVENGMYLGLPLLAVLVAFAVWLRRNRMVLFSGAMLLVTYVFSLGPRLFVNGHNTGIPLPWTLAEHLPFLQDALAIRFTLMTQFFAALMLALGLDHTVRWWEDRTRSFRYRPEVPRVLAWSAAGAVAVAALVPLTPRLPVSSAPVEVPAVFTTDWVHRIPQGSVLLTYPYPFTYYTEPQLAQIATRYRFKIPGGYVDVPGPNGRRMNPNYLPYPLRPTALVRLFLGAQGFPPGGATIPPYDADTLSQIRTYLVRYSIDTVVVDTTQRGAPLVLRYLRAVLGRPKTVGVSAVWFDVRHSLATGS